MDKWRVFIIIVFANVVVLNTLIGYLVYDNLINNDKESFVNQGSDLVIEDDVYERLKTYVDEKIGSLGSDSETPNPNLIPQPIANTTNQNSIAKTKQYNYIPIPGSGSTTQNDWVDISGTEFYFDPGEYPGAIEVRFEANMKRVNGSGAAWVRIQDITHSITVINSEVQTSSQTTANVTSDLLNFWAGRNLYRIQAKSLTADTTVYEGGRIKVVTEN